MIRHLHSLLCSLALTAVIPVRAVLGHSHRGLVDVERRIETRLYRLRQRQARAVLPVLGLLFASTLPGCWAHRLEAEYARCDRAMTVAADSGDEARVRAEADRCRENLRRLDP